MAAEIRIIGGVRYLYIGGSVQSGWDPENPDHIIYDYTKLIATALAAWKDSGINKTARVLIPGLGGGSLCRVIKKYYPSFTIEAVEIDSVITELARKYFCIDSSVTVHTCDARAFIEQSSSYWDIIIPDAFGEKGIPAALSTLEFYSAVKSRLTAGGIVIANTWLETRNENNTARTIYEAFGPMYDLRYPGGDSNRVILCGREPLPGPAEMKKRMLEVNMELGINEFDYRFIIQNMAYIDECPDGMVLTDGDAG